MNDVTSKLEEKSNVSYKTIPIDNRMSSKETNEERLVLLSIEKAEDQKSDKFRDQRSEPESIQKRNWANIHNWLKPEATEAQLDEFFI